MPQYQGQKVRYRRRGLLRLRLRQLLEARGWSAYGLAKFTGLSLNTIYRLTRPSGRFSLIRADTIERLCGALRVTPSELFEYKRPPPARRAGLHHRRVDRRAPRPDPPRGRPERRKPPSWAGRLPDVRLRVGAYAIEVTHPDKVRAPAQRSSCDTV